SVRPSGRQSRKRKLESRNQTGRGNRTACGNPKIQTPNPKKIPNPKFRQKQTSDKRSFSARFRHGKRGAGCRPLLIYPTWGSRLRRDYEPSYARQISGLKRFKIV